PSGQFIRAERNIIKMIASIDLRLSPIAAAVVGHINTAAGSDHDRVSRIEREHAAKRLFDRKKLSFPREAAVGRMQDRVVRADRKAVPLVRGKMYRINGISLRQRILPDPSAALGRRIRRTNGKNRGRKNNGRSTA